MPKSKTEKKILVEIFNELVSTLDSANYLFRNQPKYFRNLFEKYDSTEEPSKREKNYQKLKEALKKLQSKFKSDSAAEIERILKSFKDPEQERIILKYLNTEKSIIENIIAIVEAIELDRSSKNTMASQEPHLTPSPLTTDNETNTPTVKEKQDSTQSHPKDEKVAKIIPAAGKIAELIKCLKGKIASKENIELKDLSPECAEVIRLILILKSSLEEPNSIEPARNTEELIDLIYYYCTLGFKNTKTKELEYLMRLLEKNNPLDILEKYKKKYGEAISSEDIIAKVNGKLIADLDELLCYNEGSEYGVFILGQPESDLAPKVIAMTQLMSPEEISILYQRYTQSIYSAPSETREKFQNIFAEAIRLNNNYSFIIKIPETDENTIVERMIICAKYFHQLPVGFQSKEEMKQFVTRLKISHPLLAQIMIEFINNLPADMEIIRDDGIVKRAKAA